MDAKIAAIIISSTAIGYFLKQEMIKNEFEKMSCEDMKNSYAKRRNYLYLTFILIFLFAVLFIKN